VPNRRAGALPQPPASRAGSPTPIGWAFPGIEAVALRLDQQEPAAWTLIAVAMALGTTWFVAAFIGWTPSCAKQPQGR